MELPVVLTTEQGKQGSRRARGMGEHDNDTFVINMKIENGAPAITSCEVVARQHKHKILFRRPRPAAEVLTPQLAEQLDAMMEEIGGAKRVYSSPDYHLALPRLILGGLRVILTEMRDGVQYVFIRFRHFIGGLADAFRVELGFDTPTLPHRERIAVEALVDIVSPWLDILRDLDTGRPGLGAAAMERLEEMAGRSEELSFHLSLLMSYVEECRPGPRLSLVEG